MVGKSVKTSGEGQYKTVSSERTGAPNGCSKDHRPESPYQAINVWREEYNHRRLLERRRFMKRLSLLSIGIFIAVAFWGINASRAAQKETIRITCWEGYA